MIGGGLAGLTSGLTSLISVSGPEKEKTKQEAVFMDFETEISTDPFFKKFQGLKKILKKYTNKTFTVKEQLSDSLSGCDIDVQIKIEICKTFSFLMDLKQEFLIDNVIDFFNLVYAKQQQAIAAEKAAGNAVSATGKAGNNKVVVVEGFFD